MSVDYSAKLVVGVKLTKNEYLMLSEDEQVDNCVRVDSYIDDDEDNIILGCESLKANAGCMTPIEKSKVPIGGLADIVRICEKHNIELSRIQEYLICQVW